MPRPKLARKQKTKQPARKPKRKPTSTLGMIAKAAYQLFCVLPFVPGPIKNLAHIVAAQIGVATITFDQSGPQPTLRADSASPYCLCYWFVIRSNAFLLQSSFGTRSTTDFTTNYRSVRPRTMNLTVTPQNKSSNTAGHYTVALFPFDGTTSATLYEKMDTKDVCHESWLSRAAIKRESAARRSVNITYRVPKSNTYLHMGVPIQKNGDKTIADGVMAVAIIYNCDGRANYGNFNSDDAGFDIRLQCTGTPLDYDGTTAFSVWNNPIRDVINGKVMYHNPEKTTWIDGRDFKFDEETNSMYGEVLCNLTEMEMA